MTLAEAEVFFKRYDGHAYHMFHDETNVYREYDRLKISKEQENIWRLQKIEEYHERIQSDTEKAGDWVTNIIEIMYVLENVSDELLERLLDALMHISKLDVRQRILVMERMEGSNDSKGHKSGYALYSSKEKFYEKLQKTMAQIMEINEEDRDEMDRLSASGKIGWSDTYYRYLTTVNRCERMQKRLLSGENLKRNPQDKKSNQDKKYNYAEIWLAQDEQ